MHLTLAAAAAKLHLAAGTLEKFSHSGRPAGRRHLAPSQGRQAPRPRPSKVAASPGRAPAASPAGGRELCARRLARDGEELDPLRANRARRGWVLQSGRLIESLSSDESAKLKPVFRNGMSWKSPSASMASGFSPFWTLNSNRYNLGPDQFSHGITWVGESRPQNPGQIASRPVTRNRSASTRPQNGSHV